jgi:hypothetical protein
VKKKPTKAHKPDPQPFIGTYELGLINADVYAVLASTGGDFYCRPDPKSKPRMKIGFNYDHWHEVLNVLTHESFEFLCVQHRARLVPCGANPHASDVFRFHFDHNQMTNIIDDLSYFLSKSAPDVLAAWKKHRKVKP